MEEVASARLSALIFAVSLFFVSENWVAITTRQRLIMKNDPIWRWVIKFGEADWNCPHYHNETDKVYPVPERVWVLQIERLSSQTVLWLSSHLDKVHDICPSLQGDNKEDGHPGQANVVKRDGSVKRISGAGGASGVILKSEVSK